MTVHHHRFFPSLQWYLDSTLTLIEKAGDFATRDVWFSVVQLVTNHPELHEYAARKVCVDAGQALQHIDTL